jgi:hypothetical protein
MSRCPHLSILLSLILVSATAFADLHDPDNSADYLIVTTSELIEEYPWITQLADWRNQHGRVSMVVPVEDVWNEFGDGNPSDTVLKEFLHYARRNWQPPELRDVFIIGFHDVVPSHVESDDFPWDMVYLSDLFYATDPESTNYMPVLSIGRLPWSPGQSPALWNYLAKVVAYESAGTAPWQIRVHLIADHGDSYFTFWQDCELFAGVVSDCCSVERDYLDFPVGDPWHGDRDEILENFQAGSYLLSFWGPGDGGTWSSLDLNSTDFAALTNEDRLPIAVGAHLDISYDDFELGGIPAALIANPDGGAIGYFGWSLTAWYEAGRSFRLALVEQATSDSAQTLGEIWRRTVEEYIQEWGVSSGPCRQMAFGCVLLGDPGLRLPGSVSPVYEDTPTLPIDFCLEGNYPNPFNSSTKISFRVSHATRMSLKIYDVLGREVATLVDGSVVAGSHIFSWNATATSSGIYFCRMEASGFAQTRKMVLIK